MNTINVLLTGFGPFGKIHNNASAAIINFLRDNPLIHPHNINIKFLVLPVSYLQAPSILKKWLENNPEFVPDLIMSLGVHRGDYFRFETKARFQLTSKAQDIDGCSMHAFKPLIQHDLESSLNIKLLCERLSEQSQHPLVVSSNAGGYVCEAIYHTSLSLALAINEKSVISCFLHVPSLDILPADVQSHFVLKSLKEYILVINSTF